MKTCLKYTVIAVLCFFLIYFAITPFYTKKEITLEPVWIHNVVEDSSVSAGVTPPPLYPFKTSSRFGYFDKEGGIWLSKDIQANVSVTRSYWCTYDSLQLKTDIYTVDGTLQCTIDRPGFAFLTDYRFYIFMPGGDGIAAYDTDGKLLWIRESVFPVTAFNASEFGTVIGYADGTLIVIDDSGVDSGSFKPAGSTYEVILGLDISKDGSLLACVSGIDRQRFILAVISNGQFKIVHHEYLPHDERRQLFVRIDEQSNVVYYEYAENLGIFDIETKKTSRYPLIGKIATIKAEPDSRFTFILEKADAQYRLSILEDRQCIAKSFFAARNAFIIQDKDNLFLGKDDAIARIKISEQ